MHHCLLLVHRAELLTWPTRPLMISLLLPCPPASPCWQSSTWASCCSLCICSSLLSTAAINIQEKKQFGGEGFISSCRLSSVMKGIQAGTERDQGGMLLTGALQSLPSAFLFQSRLICLGMVLPTVSCALQYQSSRVSNDIPYSRVHRQICFCSGKLLNRCPFVSAVSS